MLHDNTLRTQLVKEIKSLLGDQGGNISHLLLSASQLARACGDVWYEELFKLHVDGLDVEEGGTKLTTQYDLAPDIFEAFYEDRGLSTGRSDCRPLKQLELWRRDLPAFAESKKAKEHPHVAAEIPQLMDELSTVIGRIKGRVTRFAEGVEAWAAVQLEEHATEPPALVTPISAPGDFDREAAKPTLTLIMKGGGIKGLAYVGALKELTRYYNFNWYAGTSAGAITAALLAAGVDVDGLEAILRETNFKELLLDVSRRRMLINLLTKGGLLSGNKFQAWIGNKINAALHYPTPVLLNQLPKAPSPLKHRLTVYASSKMTRTMVFDSASPVSSGIPVKFAVRCSMSIPGIFIPESSAGSRLVDGGIQNNYPVDALLKDNPGVDFIGFYLGPEVYEEEERRPTPLLETLRDLLSILLNADEEILRAHVERTIVIDPRPVSTLDFDLSEEEKDFLLKAGRASALRFIRSRGLPNGPTDDNVKKAVEEARSAKEVVIGLRAKRGRFRRFVLKRWPLLLLLLFLLPILLGASVVAVILWFVW